MLSFSISCPDLIKTSLLKEGIAGERRPKDRVKIGWKTLICEIFVDYNHNKFDLCKEIMTLYLVNKK
jgi:hypothetical protein